MIEALRGAWLVSRCAMLCFVYSSFLSLTLSPFLPFAPFTIAVFDTDNAGKDILRSGEGGGGPGMLHACNVKVAALVFFKKKIVSFLSTTHRLLTQVRFRLVSCATRLPLLANRSRIGTPSFLVLGEGAKFLERCPLSP